jgi:hypothetical protein
MISASQTSQQNIYPIRDVDDPHADYAPFTFQIRDGQVYFSRRH